MHPLTPFCPFRWNNTTMSAVLVTTAGTTYPFDVPGTFLSVFFLIHTITHSLTHSLSFAFSFTHSCDWPMTGSLPLSIPPAYLLSAYLPTAPHLSAEWIAVSSHGSGAPMRAGEENDSAAVAADPPGIDVKDEGEGDVAFDATVISPVTLDIDEEDEGEYDDAIDATINTLRIAYDITVYPAPVINDVVADLAPVYHGESVALA